MGWEVALLATRAEELLGRLGKSPPPWSACARALAAFESAKGAAAKAKALAALRRLVRRGSDAAAGYDETWAELQGLLQEKAKLSVAELRRRGVMAEMAPAEDVLALLNAFFGAMNDLWDEWVRRAEGDKDLVRALLRNLYRWWIKLLPPQFDSWRGKWAPGLQSAQEQAAGQLAPPGE
jgi:hypothetical protein